MPRDNDHTITAADYRKWAAGNFMDAAKHAFSGNDWMAGREAEVGLNWLKHAKALDKEQAEAARIERECAEFDAAMAACALPEGAVAGEMAAAK